MSDPISRSLASLGIGQHAQPPAAPTPPVAPATTTTQGYDPTQNAVVKAPAHKAGILGSFEGLKEKFEIMGPLGLLAWEAFQTWKARANAQLDEVQQSQIDAQARVDKRHDELLEAQERLNLAQQAELDDLKEKVRDLILVVDKLSARAGLYATPSTPPTPPAKPKSRFAI